MLLSKSGCRALSRMSVAKAEKLFRLLRDGGQMPAWLSQKGVSNLKRLQDALDEHNLEAWLHIRYLLQAESEEFIKLLETNLYKQQMRELLLLWVAIQDGTALPDWVSSVPSHIVNAELFREFLQEFRIEWLLCSTTELLELKKEVGLSQRENEQQRDLLADGRCHCNDDELSAYASECGHSPCWQWKVLDDDVQLYAGMWIWYTEVIQARLELGLD